MNPAIAAQVVEILHQVAPEMNPETLKPDLAFRQQMEFDSLDFLRLVLKIEERFGVSIPEDHYPRLATLEGCSGYLQDCLARRP
jgi:acyl carrier protein